jgi:glycolate oxidase FAD binding subunit
MDDLTAEQQPSASGLDRDADSAFEQFVATVSKAAEASTALDIVGGRTKFFYGRQTDGEILETSAYAGIIEYEPAELVITARAGTRLSILQEALREENQMFAFEPPSFGVNSTLGGMVSAGLSGPRRPYAGAVRDAVLGVRILSGDGEALSFGGQVMKNVAGYDVSRLVTGAMGTLGLILQSSIRVAPRPQLEATLVWQLDTQAAHRRMLDLVQRPWPISAIAYDGEFLRIRLSGHDQAVAEAQTELGADATATNEYWTELNEQSLPFFRSAKALWRLSVAPSAAISLDGDWLWDWGGACRWLKTSAPADQVRRAAAGTGGHAMLFRHVADDSPFAPLDTINLALHKRIKNTFDPHGIFNPARMYRGL